jgi:hypothetical protein
MTRAGVTVVAEGEEYAALTTGDRVFQEGLDFNAGRVTRGSIS